MDNIMLYAHDSDSETPALWNPQRLASKLSILLPRIVVTFTCLVQRPIYISAVTPRLQCVSSPPRGPVAVIQCSSNTLKILLA